ncbi:cytochrome c [Skermanella aerolata]|nr:cytochrome c [Skermanella aerolata]
MTNRHAPDIQPKRGRGALRMLAMLLAVSTSAGVAAWAFQSTATGHAEEQAQSMPSAGEPNAADQIERGRYLVNLGGCNDCHTPGYFLGKPDPSRRLAGSDVGFEIPGTGIFVGSNLTPDRDTGLGNWTREDIMTAVQTGVRPDGRILAPIMPWRAFAELTKSDAGAIADYLISLPPISQKVPGPFGPDEKPNLLVMKVTAPDGSAEGG